MTTIIITHDLGPIEPSDFVYVMKEGEIVEQGYREDLELAENGAFAQMAHMQASMGGKAAAEAETLTATPPRPAFTPRMSSAGVMQTARHSVRASMAPGGQFSNPMRAISQMRHRSTYAGDEVEAPDAAQNQFLEELFGAPPAYSGEAVHDKRSSHMPAFVFEKTAANAAVARRAMPNIRNKAIEKSSSTDDIKMPAGDSVVDIPVHSYETQPSMISVYRKLFRCIPNKPLLALGFFFCAVCGITPPFFSSLTSQMLASLGNNQPTSALLKTALLLLGIAVIDGTGIWLKYSVLQRVAMGWVTSLREKSFFTMLRQDKSWFDEPRNTAISLSNITVKDIDDARSMIGMIAGQFLIVIIMLIFGLTWAMVAGWELTMIGLAIAPVMILVLGWQTRVLGRCEFQNKLLREDIMKKFHQVRVFFVAPYCEAELLAPSLSVMFEPYERCRSKRCSITITWRRSKLRTRRTNVQRFILVPSTA